MGCPENHERAMFEDLRALHLDDLDYLDRAILTVHAAVRERLCQTERQRVVVLREAIPMIGREYMRA